MLTAAIASSQDGPPSGTVSLESKSIAVGVGFELG
jgi:hypothetical protein